MPRNSRDLQGARRRFDRIASPDLWDQITARIAEPRPVDTPERTLRGPARLVVVLVALIVPFSIFGLYWTQFRSGSVAQSAGGSDCAPPSSVNANGSTGGPGVDLGEAPTALAFGLGAEWAIIQSTNCLVKIDANTLAVNQSYAVGDTPSSLAVGGAAVWVANQGDGTVTRVDPATGGVTTLKIGGTPTAIAAEDKGVWVADFAEGTVARLDPASGAIVATIKVAAQLDSIAADGESVWVGSADDGKIYRIDPLTNSVVADVLVVGIPEIAVGDGYLWVMSGALGEVLKLDPLTGEALTKNEVIPGGSPVSVVYQITVGENGVWLLAGGTSLYQLDKTTLQIISSTSVPQGAADVATGGGGVWLASGSTIERVSEDAATS